jgi:CheY-like chemotaxis protein
MTTTVAETSHVPAGAALIVDDEPAIRAAIRRWFERRGWTVDEADDGETALPLLEAAEPSALRHYDLIVADLRMRRVGGADLHRWLSVHRPDLLARLVIATGDAQESEAAAFLESSRCRVLEKPFALASLADLLPAVSRGDA